MVAEAKSPNLLRRDQSSLLTWPFLDSASICSICGLLHQYSSSFLRQSWLGLASFQSTSASFSSNLSVTVGNPQMDPVNSAVAL